MFSRDQYWAQIYWKLPWMSGRLLLNPTDKIFSRTTIGSALTTTRAQQLGNFGCSRQSKPKLCCATGRNLGQAGEWETCPRKQWLKWMRSLFLHILPKGFFLIWPFVEAGWYPAPLQECRRAVVMLCGQMEKGLNTHNFFFFLLGSGNILIGFESISGLIYQ